MPDGKSARAECIRRMQDALTSVGKVDCPRWALTIPIAVIFVYEVVRLLLVINAHCIVDMIRHLFKCLSSPFIAIRVYVDVFLITFWFFRRILNKMCGDEDK